MASIFRNGDRWRAQVRVNGKARSKSFDSKRAARIWAAKIEGETAETLPSSGMSLREAMQRYSDLYTSSKKGALQEANRVSLWKKHDLSARPLGDIKPRDIAEWIKMMEGAGKAPSTIRNLITLVSQTYKFAIAELGIEGIRNPVPGVRLPKNRAGRDRRLESGELERLLEACVQLPNLTLHDMIIVAVETAMRRGELLSLRLEDVKGRVARIRKSKTDTGQRSGRAVPLTPRAAEVLRARGSHGVAFPFLDSREMERAWHKVRDMAGCGDLKFHDLRHEGVSKLFEMGLTTEQVMKVSGHRTHAMAMRYTHLRVDDLVTLLG